MILEALVLQTKLFLSEDMDIKVENVDIINNSPDKLYLKDYTSMIGTGGKLNIVIIVTFETRLMEHLVEKFMDGEEVEDDEKDEIFDSVSGETTNTIIGLALPTFPNRGKGVTITPPITMSDASNIKKYKHSKLICAEVQTSFGSLSISAMGSEDSIK